jgi:GDP-L-fucose synthase
MSNDLTLVTGATGMIGRALVPILVSRGEKVLAVSLDQTPIEWEKWINDGSVTFKRIDLRNLHNVELIMSGVDSVFHLAGIKGSPRMTQQQPASFFTNTMMFNLNVMEAARRSGVRRFLYTSSIGVYAPAQTLFEDSVEGTFPSSNDRFAGYAKRMGELQAEAFKIEFGWDCVCIVRPANVYGPHDNFDPSTGMVIPSLIHKALNGDGVLEVWGDGSPIRDFVYVSDVAEAMVHLMDISYRKPVNIGSGIGRSIRELVQIIQLEIPDLKVTWSNEGPPGDDIRVMDISRLKETGFSPKTTLEAGVALTIEWYSKHRNLSEFRYNAFYEQSASVDK